MPITPFHYGAAYAINKVKAGLVLPALIMGSAIPDLEPLFASVTMGNAIPQRGLMHSLVGAATLDVLLTVLVTTFLYPASVSWIFKLEKKDIEEKCEPSLMVALSALAGSLSHVFIDSTSHQYNPLLYPFNSESFDTLVLFNNWFLASVIVHIILATFLFLILVNEIKKGKQGFWKRVLVEYVS